MRRTATATGTAMLLAVTSACSVFGGGHHKQSLQPEQAVAILHTRLSDLKTGMPVFKPLKKRDDLSAEPCDNGPGETNGPVVLNASYGMPYQDAKGGELAEQFEDFLKARGWSRNFRTNDAGAAISMRSPDNFNVLLNVQANHAYVDIASSCLKDPGYAFLKSHS